MNSVFYCKVNAVRETLRVDRSFDLLERQIVIGGHKAHLFFVDAFTKDEVMEKIFEFMMRISPEQLAHVTDSREFASLVLPYVEIDREKDLQTVVTAVLSGTTAMIVEGFDEIFMIDARTYPVRSIDEPQDDRVLRGSHDGFVETMVFNAALIRRRIRDPRLTLEPFKVGSKSQTDVVLCYMDGICDLCSKISEDAINHEHKDTDSDTFCDICGYHVYYFGDMNADGRVTAADARLALRISAKLEDLTDYGLFIVLRVSSYIISSLFSSFRFYKSLTFYAYSRSR